MSVKTASDLILFRRNVSPHPPGCQRAAPPDAMSDHDELLRAYAELVVRAGVNLGPGQELLVEAQLDRAPLVRAITEEAYAAGARFVDVSYADPYVRRARAGLSPDDVLGW